MRKQIKLLSSNKTWSENGRYKVNEVVTFEGQDYQNVTGANSSPDDLVDWFLQPSLNSFEQIKNANFTAEYGVKYIVNGSTTITDPTPIESMGYVFYVLRGTTTVGGVNYQTTSLIYRYYSYGAWITKDISNVADISDILTSLGTKVERGVNNTTTIALTSANLNSAYPSATTGFRVYCTSIIAGKMVYEKTPTGWVGMAVIIP
jgi:hypothetical protein